MSEGEATNEEAVNPEQGFKESVVQFENHTVTRIEKPALWSTFIETNPNTQFELKLDPNFISSGMVTEPNSLLIDQAATAQKWGRTAGALPTDFLANLSAETSAIHPTNWGWQQGAVLIQEGKILQQPNDEYLNTNSSQLDAFVLKNQKWQKVTLEFNEGQPTEETQEALKDAKVGFSLPVTADTEGNTNLKDLLTDPRIVADYRNLFDFANGKKVPAEFWLSLRKILPNKRSAGSRLLDGRVIVERRSEDLLTENEYASLKQVINDNGLSDIMQIDEKVRENGRKDYRLAITDQLPLQKLPLVGVGITESGNLLVGAFDGRQEVPGVTIQEMTRLMKERGAVTVGLGSAGGDVAIVTKTTEGMSLHNSPSNLIDNKRAVRAVPSVLAIR